jgi:hypothetical protein
VATHKIWWCTGGAVIILFKKTPIFWNEVDLKYGNRDITLGSLVFCCSKDNKAGGGPLPEHIYKDKNLIFAIW